MEEKENENTFDAKKFDWLINESILTFNLGGDLLMHYFNPNTKENKLDPSWQNQGIYFWFEKEKFEKKSLPDEFKQFQKKLFIINSIPEYLKIKSGEAMPWFGKPGGGVKLFFSYNDDPITLSEAQKLNTFSYVEKLNLNVDNLSVLQDRDNYIFITEKEVSFKGSLPMLNGVKTTLSELYHKGKLNILRKL